MCGNNSYICTGKGHTLRIEVIRLMRDGELQLLVNVMEKLELDLRNSLLQLHNKLHKGQCNGQMPIISPPSNSPYMMSALEKIVFSSLLFHNGC